MSALFVAGAGTDVGKTHVACALIRTLRAGGAPVAAIKPLVSGIDEADWAASDPGRLLAALGRPLTAETLAAISPWRYRAPLAPDMAAAPEGREVEVEAVIGFCRDQIVADAHRRLLIEGVGGVMSPIATLATNLDWMCALGCPVLLVGGSYLGSISHTLTAIAALRGAGLSLAGVVISQSADAQTPFDETVASVARLSGAAVVAAGRDAEDASWTSTALGMIGWTS